MESKIFDGERFRTGQCRNTSGGTDESDQSQDKKINSPNLQFRSQGLLVFLMVILTYF